MGVKNFYKIAAFIVAASISGGARAQQTTLPVNTSSTDARAIIAPTSAALPAATEGLIIPRVNRFPASGPASTAQGLMLYLQAAYTTTSAPPPGTIASNTYAIGFYYWTGGGGAPANTWQLFTLGRINTNLYGTGTPTGSCVTNSVYTDTALGSPTAGKQYTCTGAGWVAYTAPVQSPFYFYGSTSDAGSSKVAPIARPNIMAVVNSDNARFAQIGSDGNIELMRSLSSPTPTVNGFIDFKDDPSHDYDFRLYWDHSINNNSGAFNFGVPNMVLPVLSVQNGGRVGVGTVTP